MTPKEKAENLVNQYRMILMSEDTECGNEILCTSIAIKNSLIAVDLHLEELSKMKLIFSDRELHLKYWQEVKQEIEKL
jgi:hypothetical protein